MVVPVAEWATIRGHRFTSADDTLSLDVIPKTNYTATGSGGEGGIASVVFTINGVTQPAVTERTERTPNFNEVRCPLTGTARMAPVWSYGMDLNAADYDNGTITVTAVATTVAGNSTNLPTLKVYNNKDSDTRPTSRTIYVDPTGDNANDGLTRANAVVSVQKAAELVAVSKDCGGGRIVFMSGAHEWAGYSFGMDTDLHTSDQWWLRLVFEAGATIQRPGTMNTSGLISWGQGADTFRMQPANGDPDIVNIMVVAEDENNQFLTRGDLRIQTEPTTDTHLLLQGGVWGSQFWSLSNRLSVRFAEEAVRVFEHVTNGGNAGSGEMGSVCSIARGVDSAYRGFTWNLNGRVEDWIWISFSTTSRNSKLFLYNVELEYERYDQNVLGLIDCKVESGVELAVIDANNVRIQQSSVSSNINPLADFGNPDTSQQIDDISTHGAELAASSLWGVGFFTGSSLNDSIVGTQGLEVTSAGTNATGPYFEVNWPSHGQTAGAITWRIRTANKLRDNGSGQIYVYKDVIHPNICQFEADCLDSIIANVRTFDCLGLRGWSASSGVMRRLYFENVGDTSHGENTDLNPPTMEDCGFHNVTMGTNWNWGSITPTGITEVRWCRIENLNNEPASGVIWDGNHFKDPAEVQGTNARSGSFYENDPTVTPWDMTPTVANQGVGSGDAIPFPSRQAYAETNTEGVWNNIAEGDYSAPPAPPVVTPVAARPDKQDGGRATQRSSSRSSVVAAKIKKHLRRHQDVRRPGSRKMKSRVTRLGRWGRK